MGHAESVRYELPVRMLTHGGSGNATASFSAASERVRYELLVRMLTHGGSAASESVRYELLVRMMKPEADEGVGRGPGVRPT